MRGQSNIGLGRPDILTEYLQHEYNRLKPKTKYFAKNKMRKFLRQYRPDKTPLIYGTNSASKLA